MVPAAFPGKEPDSHLSSHRIALVSIELVPALPGRPDDAAWEAAYTHMIEQARKHGWIDAETNAIRAHVEREA